MQPLEIAVALLLAGVLLPQSAPSPRGRALGLVTDAQGAAVAGAEVTLWSWPLPSRIDIGKPDRVVVRTGANGRFSAEILDGRTYSAFAAWQDTAGRHCSGLATEVVPGSPRTLQQAPTRARCTIALQGGAAFRANGPLQVTWIVGSDNPLVTPLEPATNGEVVLPELPPAPSWIDVRDTTGQLVRSVALMPDPGQTRQVIALPDARKTTIAVQDDAGLPIATAAVHVLYDFGYHGVTTRRRVFAPAPVGQTGADGTLAVALPAEHPVLGSDMPRIALLVTAPGHQRHQVNVLLSPSQPRVVARLRPGTDLRGRFVDRDGAPITTGILPLYESFAQSDVAHMVGGFVPLPPMVMPIGADGTFHGPGLHAGSGLRVFAVMAAEQAIALGLPLRADFGVPPLLPIALMDAVPGRDGKDLGDIRLDRLRMARLAVLQHDKAPATGVRVRLLHGGSFAAPIDFIADRRGRLQLPLPAGAYRIGVFVPGGGVATVAVQVPDDLRDDQPLELRLSEPREVRGFVSGVDPSIATETSVVLSGVDGVDRYLAELAYAAVTISAPAPDGGAFVMRVPFGDASYQVRARRGSSAVGLAVDGTNVTVPVTTADVSGVEVPAPAAR